MAQYTATDWALQLLSDVGAPTTQNNVNSILHWMVAEEPGNDWFNRNNPLNASLGTSASDGTGSYQDLTAAAHMTAAMINQSNMTGIRNALMANASLDTFSAAVVASPWASSHYGGNPNHIASTDAMEGSVAAPTSAGAYGGAGQMSAADWQALYQAQQKGGTAYLEALATQAQQAPSTSVGGGGSTAAAPNTATGSTQIGGVTYSGTAQQTSALSTIEGELQTYGFTPDQVSQLTNWAWGEITNNVDPTQIAIDLQNQPAFQQQFPGFAPANAELNAKGLPAVSVQQYQQYQTQAMALAQAAGLPPGMINSANVGQLVGGNVSINELTARVNDAKALAYQSTPEQQAMFNNYFGANYTSAPGYSGMTAQDWQALSQAVAEGGSSYLQAGSAAAAATQAAGGLTNGQIAAIALDPNVAEPLIAQQITTSQIGGAAVTSGVGALDKATAQQLAQAGITTSQATSAFQNLAPFATLEQQRPGMGAEGAQGVVTANQLATGALLGNTGDLRQLQTAEEVAKQPFTGGGGFVSNTRGAVGTGSASPQGAGNA